MSNDAAKAVLEWAFAGFLIALMVCALACLIAFLIDIWSGDTDD